MSATESTGASPGEMLNGAEMEVEMEVEIVPKAVPRPAAPHPSAPEPEPIPPGGEMAAIAAALQGIHAELKRLNDQISAVVEPSVLLNHYRKGAAVRVDDSHSRVHNPTF